MSEAIEYLNPDPETVTIPRELFERLTDAASDYASHLKEITGESHWLRGLISESRSIRASLAPPPETRP